jgi:hypothetical protein
MGREECKALQADSSMGCGADSSIGHVSPAGRSGLKAIPNLDFRTEILAWKVSFDSSRREVSKASTIELNRPIPSFLLGVD